MDIALWILQAILAIKILTTSISHGLGQSKPAMQESIINMGKYSRQLHFIVSLLTFIAALGLIIPGILGWAACWIPLTALATAFLLLCSLYIHVRTRPKPMIFVSLVLLAFALLIAYGRWMLVPLG